MRSHVQIVLSVAIGLEAPHWRDVLDDKAGVPTRLHPAIDRVLDRHRVAVWVTAEYPRAGARWSADEIAAGLDRVYRLVLQEDRPIPRGLVEELARLPVVERVTPIQIGRAELPEPRAAALDARTDRRSREAILLPEAHLLSRGDPEIVVAVLDTGVDPEHPELAGCLLPGRDFVDILDGAKDFVGDFLDADPEPWDEVGHGTHVAGIIAGAGRGMPVGVAPRCKLLPVRVLAAMRQGDRLVGAGVVDNIATALKWTVDRGVHVVNMSLGVKALGGRLPYADVVAYAARKGVTIVAAAGNQGDDEAFYPAALPSVLTVGAADDDGRAAAFSSFGGHVDLLAPGTRVYSSTLGGRYAFSSGTSHAAPFVAGAAALLVSYGRARGRRLGDRHVKHLLKRTADGIGRAPVDRRAGFGRLNARDALRLAEHRLG